MRLGELLKASQKGDVTSVTAETSVVVGASDVSFFFGRSCRVQFGDKIVSEGGYRAFSGSVNRP